MKKHLSLGISDFKKFIDENCYFVDKTHLIKYLIENPSKVHLITRPRRFGKTLNLSMVRYFFEAPYPGSDEPDNAYLFEGMSIASLPQCRQYLGQYPVIHLSLKNVKKSTYQDCMALVRNMLSDEYRRHEYLQNCGVLNDREQEKFKKIIYNEGTDQDCEESIVFLSMWLKRAYGKPAYILLDEYDTPMMAAYLEGHYKQMTAFIRSFMVQTFKDNPNLKQAVVIGILKAAQESIFSDFNNPEVSTLLDPDMDDCFGFTDSEVANMASYYDLKDEMTDIRQWYNGYIFGSDTVIYNPWSIVNFLRKPTAGLRPYWVNTSDNRLVREALHLERNESIEIVSRLLQKKEVRKELYHHIVYQEIGKNPDAVWSFLLHGGYLKATDKQRVHADITYNLSIPNIEVEYVYNKIIKSWLDDEFQAREDFLAFIKGVRELNPRLIEMSLAAMLRVQASFHDMASSGGEMFYHGMLLGLLAYLGGEYMVDSNREYGTGRADIVLAKRAAGGRTWSGEALLFELKHENSDGKTPLEQLSAEALSQAMEKYTDGVLGKWQPKRTLVLGIGFRGKKLALTYETLSHAGNTE